MDYVTLGNTGLLVSRLSFGAMTFTQGSQRMGPIAKVGEAGAEAMVGRALEAGINFFDTADTYSEGQSEIMLGRALKARRKEAVVATKCGFPVGAAPVQGGLSRRHILWSVDESLKRLGTDWIDILICHKEDAKTPLEETVAALDQVVRAGKVRYHGFSNWSAWRVAAAMEIQKANGLAPFCHGQMHYSLIVRDVEREIIPMMRRYGLGLTVWSPLVSGLLSGRYKPGVTGEAGARYGAMKPVFLPYDEENAFKVVERLKAIAERHGASVAQIALAWLLANPAVTSILVGASSEAQLQDNLGALAVRLTEAEQRELAAMTEPAKTYPHWFNVVMNDLTLLRSLAEKA